MDGVSCVVASPKHTETLVAFYREMDREQGLDVEASERGLRAALDRGVLDDGRMAVFLALEDRRAVGYAATMPIPKLDERVSVLFVDELYVLKGCRRRGVAALLLTAIADYAQDQGAWRVRLLTHEDNLPAMRLYDRYDYDAQRLMLREYTVPRRQQRL